MPKYAKKRASRKTLRRKTNKRVYKKKSAKRLKKTYKISPEVMTTDLNISANTLGTAFMCYPTTNDQYPGYCCTRYPNTITSGTANGQVIGRSYVITGLEAHVQVTEQASAASMQKIKIMIVKDRQPTNNVYSYPMGGDTSDPIQAMYERQRFVSTGVVIAHGNLISTNCDRQPNSRSRFKIMKTKTISFLPDNFNNQSSVRNKLIKISTACRETVKVDSAGSANTDAHYFVVVLAESGNSGGWTGSTTGTLTNAANTGWTVNMDLRMKYVDP